MRALMLAAIVLAGCDAPSPAQAECPQPSQQPLRGDVFHGVPVGGQIDEQLSPAIVHLLRLRGHGNAVKPPIDDRRIDAALVAMLSFQCEFDVTAADLAIYDELVRAYPDLAATADLRCLHFAAPGVQLDYNPATLHWEPVKR
jgi:hypothetical protein